MFSLKGNYIIPVKDLKLLKENFSTEVSDNRLLFIGGEENYRYEPYSAAVDYFELPIVENVNLQKLYYSLQDAVDESCSGDALYISKDILVDESVIIENKDNIAIEGTSFKRGPEPEDVTWWIAKIRNDFPKIEIIAGTAIYRIPEISLFLKAGANAITKLPATKIFNTKEGRMVEEEVKKSGRKFISKFVCEDLENEFDFEKKISELDINDSEKKKVREKLDQYLNN